jgi:hypothetical protein
MVCFQTKNPNLGRFWRVLQWKMFVSFMVTWVDFSVCVIFYGHFGRFVVIRYIFSHVGILYQEKSGNPDYITQIRNSWNVYCLYI